VSDVKGIPMMKSNPNPAMTLRRTETTAAQPNKPRDWTLLLNPLKENAVKAVITTKI